VTEVIRRVGGCGRGWSADTLVREVRKTKAPAAQRQGPRIQKLELDNGRKLHASRSAATQERVANAYIASGGQP
jgi:hypothetical protein